MKLLNRSIFVLLFVFSNISVSIAHSGGIDSSGCHTNHSNGTYHCHKPKRAIQNDLDPSRSPSSVKAVSIKVHKHESKKCNKKKNCYGTY